MWRPILLCCLCLLPACRTERDSGAADRAEAISIGTAECGACGMVVRDQPAPRGQVVHRDGERAFFCSIGDMLVYLESPSSHGAPHAVFVETLSVDQAPTDLNTSEQIWRLASSAGFVTGIPRSGIMGEPVMVYTSQEEASRAVSTHGGQSLGWEELREAMRRQR